MPVEPLRHLEVFSPTQFGNQRVDVVGAGATGSAVTLELAKLGITNLHVWDFDKVEDHNLANQLYGPEDIGYSKVDSLWNLVKDQADTEITLYEQELKGDYHKLGEYVFVLTDTMESRKSIIESACFFSPRTRAVIETRMAASFGYLYCFDPKDKFQLDAWQQNWYGDDQAETSACGASTTVGATARLISSIAIWQFLRKVETPSLNEELLVSMIPPMIQARALVESVGSETVAA